MSGLLIALTRGVPIWTAGALDWLLFLEHVVTFLGAVNLGLARVIGFNPLSPVFLVICLVFLRFLGPTCFVYCFELNLLCICLVVWAFVVYLPIVCYFNVSHGISRYGYTCIWVHYMYIL